MNNSWNVTPLFPHIRKHLEKHRFLRSLKVMRHLSEHYIANATADQLRQKRQQLIDGRALLTDDDTKSEAALCDRLIKALTARLAVIPTERYLQSQIDADDVQPPGFVKTVS